MPDKNATAKVGIAADKQPSPAELVSTLQVAATQLREISETLRQKRLLREANTEPERPDEGVLKKLDSSVKRNTALIKKVRQVNEDTREGLLDDIRRTNQSKYVSEAVSALAEANLKPKDISAALQVASLLHQRYADFGGALADALSNSLLAACTDTSEEERVSMARMRAWLRLLGGVHSLGLGGDVATLLKILRSLSEVDYGRQRERGQACLSVVASFAKAGREEFLGMPLQLPSIPGLPEEGGSPSEVATAQAEVTKLLATVEEEQAKRFALPKAAQAQCLQIMSGAFDSASAAVEKEHATLLDIEQQNLRALNHRGDLPEEMANQYEGQRKAFDSLHKAALSLAESLGRSMPHLDSGGTTRLRAEGTVGVLGGKESSVSGPYDDEETRFFYATLTDVRALVPAVLLSKGQEREGSQPTSPAEPASPMEGAGGGGGMALEEALALEHRDPVPAADGDPQAVVADAEPEPEEKVEGAADVKGEVLAAISQIRNCTSQQGADDAALAFCYVNSKGARRRLVRMLLTDQKVALQQLPLFARIVATLDPVFPDISAALLSGLEAEFSKLLAKKDATQRTLDARLRNCRFVAELTKFRICPYGTFFIMLKSLLDDFTGHNIDTAASAVEAAGRFLYLLPETAQRMANMLEVMVKLKNGRHVDPRQSLAVDSAYLACKPPDRAHTKQSRHPPARRYMRHLIHDRLDETHLKQVTKGLRRVQWAENEYFLVRCLLSGVKGRFSRIPLLASLAASLSKYHPTLGVALADELLEEVHVALHTPDSAKFQRRVGHMKLLGEMYNYRLMDSLTIFETLYLLLSFGHQTPEDVQRYDPPSNYFRVRLVCVLLTTCGQYFAKGSAAARLDRFLTYFQRYLLYKPPLPLDIEFDVQDLLEQLRPKLVRFATFEEACRAVDQVEMEEARNAAAGLPDVQQSESDDEPLEYASDRDQRGRGEENSEGDISDAEGVEDLEGYDEVRLLQPVTQAQEVDEDFEREFAALTMQNPSSAVRATSHHAPEVPANLALAVKSRESADRDAAERAEMKRLVLEAGDRDDGGVLPLPKVVQPRTAVKQPGGGHRGHGHPSRGGPTSASRGRGGRTLADSGAGRGRNQSRGRGQRYTTSTLAPVQETSP